MKPALYPRFKFSLLLLIAASVWGCKKDVLHLQRVVKVDSYSDTDRLNKVFFMDSLNGFITGGHRFLHSFILTTRNGGNTWLPTAHPATQKGIYDINASPAGTLFNCGFDGKLLLSTDTGRSWRFFQNDYFPYTGIAFTDPTHAIMVGGVSFDEGRIMWTDTTGAMLRRQDFRYQLNKIQMAGRTGYICGFGAVLYTSNGGENWTLQDVHGDNFTAMDIHGAEIWLCGNAGSVFHTTNGGSNWQRLRNGDDLTLPRYRLTDMKFRGSQNGWATTEDGLLLHSDDGGHHWMEYDRFTHAALRSLAFAPAGGLIAVGDNGEVYRIYE
ncbi:MAG: hypothetical protein H7257_11320 [Taibaiella sp.]|nr:hypothetical protein [Taibaiella sp.]